MTRQKFIEDIYELIQILPEEYRQQLANGVDTIFEQQKSIYQTFYALSELINEVVGSDIENIKWKEDFFIEWIVLVKKYMNQA